MIDKGARTDAVPPRSWAALALLFVIGVVNYLDRSIISILQIPMKAELGFSDTQLGLLLGASFGLVYTTLGLPFGRLADRSSRKGVLAAALLLWTALTALTGFAKGFGTLLICRMGVAVGEAACAPLSHSLISDLFPRHRRAGAVAIWALSLPLGGVLGALAGGWLGASLGWRHAFLWVGLGGMILVPVTLLALREPRRGQYDGVVEQPPLPPLAPILGLMWRSRAYRFILIAAALHLFTFYSVSTWMPQFYARAHGLGTREVGSLMAALGGIGTTAGMIVSGALSGRLGRRDARWYLRLPAIASALLVPMTIGQLWAPTLTTSAVFGVASASLMQVYFAPMIAMTQSLMPARVRSFTGAFYVFFANVFAMSVGPLAVGLVSDHLGGGPAALAAAMTLGIVGTALAIIFFLRAARTVREDLEAAQSQWLE